MVAPKIDITQTASELLDVCDEAIVLPSLHMSNRILRISHKIARMVYAFVTGYEISQLYNRNSGYFGRVIIRSYKIRLLMLYFLNVGTNSKLRVCSLSEVFQVL